MQDKYLELHILFHWSMSFPSWSSQELFSILCISFQRYIKVFIGLVGRVFANGPEDRGSIPSWVIPKTLKTVFDTSLLSIISYVSRVKWHNPGEEVAPSLTPQCSSYWKGSFWVALDYGHQLYFYILFMALRSENLTPKKCNVFCTTQSIYHISMGMESL